MRQGERSLILPGGRNFPKEHHSSCSESRRGSGMVQGEETTSDKVGITLKDHIFMQGTAKCIFLLPHRVPRNASRPSESHNSFAEMEWKGTCYEMPRANFQSCWDLIYECGVCSPRVSLIRWLSGLTSPMGIKGMISTGATGIERQNYVCTTMPVHFPFRNDIQGKTYIQESRCQGGQQAVEYFCSSSHSVWFLCSALRSSPESCEEPSGEKERN